MVFLQWLYTYATKFGPEGIELYGGYEKRLDALRKQSKICSLIFQNFS